MPKCAVTGCLKKCRKTVIYYPLPTDSFRKEQWLNACGINHHNKPSIKICSLHFKNNDFTAQYISNGGSVIFKKLLKKTAIPTIDTSVIQSKSRLRTQKREIRSYVLATQRRFAVNAYLDKYSLRTLSNLALSSCRYNSALLYKICEKENEVSGLKELIKKLRQKNLKLKLKYQYWKKCALKRDMFGT